MALVPAPQLSGFQRAMLSVRLKLQRLRHKQKKPQKLESSQKIILGRIVPIPDDLADTAHLSILNFPAETNGHVTAITVHLGQEPPGGGRRWEVLIYKMVGGHRFSLVAKRRIQIDSTCRRPQKVSVVPPLPIKQGQFVGIVNKDGKLRLTYTRGWEQEVATWDLWYQESQPPGQVGSTTSPLFMWNGSVGWYACMDPDEPEPEMVCPKSTLANDLLELVDDKSSADITFLVGRMRQPVYAHRSILVVRSAYFRALLAGGFAENGAQQLVIPEISREVFVKVLEFIYTDHLQDFTPDMAVELMRWASRYCLPRLLAQCEVYLRDLVTVQNLEQMLKLARCCHAVQLEAYCNHFMRKHGVQLAPLGGGNDAEPSKHADHDSKVG